MPLCIKDYIRFNKIQERRKIIISKMGMDPKLENSKQIKWMSGEVPELLDIVKKMDQKNESVFNETTLLRMVNKTLSDN